MSEAPQSTAQKPIERRLREALHEVRQLVGDVDASRSRAVWALDTFAKALKDIVESGDLIDPRPSVGRSEDPAGIAEGMANTARDALEAVKDHIG